MPPNYGKESGIDELLLRKRGKRFVCVCVCVCVCVLMAHHHSILVSLQRLVHRQVAAPCDAALLPLARRLELQHLQEARLSAARDPPLLRVPLAAAELDLSQGFMVWGLGLRGLPGIGA